MEVLLVIVAAFALALLVLIAHWWIRRKCHVCGERAVTIDISGRYVCDTHAIFGNVSGNGLSVDSDTDEQEYEESDYLCSEHDDTYMLWVPVEGPDLEAQICPEGGCIFLHEEDVMTILEHLELPEDTPSEKLLSLLIEAYRQNPVDYVPAPS